MPERFSPSGSFLGDIFEIMREIIGTLMKDTPQNKETGSP